MTAQEVNLRWLKHPTYSSPGSTHPKAYTLILGFNTYPKIYTPILGTKR